MTPFRYQSSEGGGIITVYALNQDEADAVLFNTYPNIKFMPTKVITYEFEVIDNTPTARVIVNGIKHTAYYVLNTANPKPDWCPAEVWMKALDYDQKTMF